VLAAFDKQMEQARGWEAVLNVEEHCLSRKATSTSLPYLRSSAHAAMRRPAGCRARWRRKALHQKAANPLGLRILLWDKTLLAFQSWILLVVSKYHLCQLMMKTH